jgi:DNA-binding response OmpR family regulator
MNRPPVSRAPRPRVLVVEDDPDVRDALGLTLERAGLQPLLAAAARDGLRTLADERPDALILDLGLPDLDGWQVLERIREVSDIPVLVLTARSLELDKVRGLQSGADDYLTKPFGNQELVARIHALLRRGRPAAPPEEVVRDERLDLEIDVANHRVTVQGAEVELTPVEWRLLVALARHRGTVLSREQLLELAWGDPSHVGPERVKFAVLRLRRKLGPAGELIENVRGFGYRLA